MNSSKMAMVKNRPSSSRSHLRCYVKGCISEARDDPNLSFHKLPKPGTYFTGLKNAFGKLEKVDLYEAWKMVLKFDKPNPTYRICSLHFTEDDYYKRHTERNFLRLKINAVPSINLPAKLTNIKSSKRLARRENRSSAKQDSPEKCESDDLDDQEMQVASTMINEEVQITDNESDDEIPLENIRETLKNILNLERIHQNCKSILDDSLTESLEATDHLSTEILIKSTVTNENSNWNQVQNVPSESINNTAHFSDNEVESLKSFIVCNIKIIEDIETLSMIVNIIKNATDEKTNDNYNGCMFKDIIKNEIDLSVCTGLENFKILGAIVKMVYDVCNVTFKNDPVKMKVVDRIIMTYMVLKQNLSYEFLALVFNCTPGNCQSIVYKMIKILSVFLSQAIYWPTKKELSRNLPKCFKNFENVAVVLNTMEVCIHKPQSVPAQMLCFSDNKGFFTVKFMTGFTPGGLISYISEGYGGKATETKMCIQSNLPTLVQQGQSILTGKQFSIDDMLVEFIEVHNWRLITPPSLSDNLTFTKAESNENIKIAAALVYSEKVEQRIKSFKILQSVFPSQLVPLLENIFTVICCTINLSSPIVKDELKEQLI